MCDIVTLTEIKDLNTSYTVIFLTVARVRWQAL